MIKIKRLAIVFALSTVVLSACNSPAMISETEVPNAGGTNESMSAENSNDDSETTPPEVNAPEAQGAESSQMDVSSTCYHPYFPITEGAFWTYQEANGEDYTLNVDQTSNNTFTLTQTFEDSDLTLEMDWYCSENGLLNGTFAQVDLFDQMAGTDDPEITFETLEWEGSTLPPVDLLAIGYQWVANYEMSGDMTIEGVTTTTQINVKIDNTISAVEEVTVPAGTFSDAYRVDSVGMIEMVIMMGEVATPLTGIEFNYSTWYVEGIGMVKSSNDYAGMQADVELIASSFIP